jgi:hypothetical protein
MARADDAHKVGSTEYKTIFLAHAGATPRNSFKPPQKALARDVPMVCDTTNKLDFVKHLTVCPTPRPPPVYIKPEGKICEESEYTKEFRSKTPEPAKPVLPVLNNMRMSNEPFNGVTTQAKDYVPHEIPTKEFYGEKRVYQPPTEPFAKSTTVKMDFTGLPLMEPTKTFKPSQAAKLSSDPFKGNSSYKDSFKFFPLPEKFKKVKEIYRPSTEPFNGLSTFAAEFPYHTKVRPPSSFKPPVTVKRADAPIDSVTTTRQSYRKWDLPPRFSRPSTIYEAPKEKFDVKSSFKSDFIDPGVPEPTINYKPKIEPLKRDAPMEHNTIHRLDYQPVVMLERQQPIRKERPYEAPVDRFEGISTTSKSYRGDFGPPATSTKPMLKPYSKKDEFQGESTYRVCYSQGGFKPDFITGSLEKPIIPGYVFSHEDSKTGHKFYLPSASVEASPQATALVAAS